MNPFLISLSKLLCKLLLGLESCTIWDFNATNMSEYILSTKAYLTWISLIWDFTSSSWHWHREKHSLDFWQIIQNKYYTNCIFTNEFVSNLSWCVQVFFFFWLVPRSFLYLACGNFKYLFVVNSLPLCAYPYKASYSNTSKLYVPLY